MDGNDNVGIIFYNNNFSLDMLQCAYSYKNHYMEYNPTLRLTLNVA